MHRCIEVRVVANATGTQNRASLIGRRAASQLSRRAAAPGLRRREHVTNLRNSLPATRIRISSACSGIRYGMPNVPPTAQNAADHVRQPTNIEHLVADANTEVPSHHRQRKRTKRQILQRESASRPIRILHPALHPASNHPIERRSAIGSSNEQDPNSSQSPHASSLFRPTQSCSPPRNKFLVAANASLPFLATSLDGLLLTPHAGIAATKKFTNPCISLSVHPAHRSAHVSARTAWCNPAVAFILNSRFAHAHMNDATLSEQRYASAVTPPVRIFAHVPALQSPRAASPRGHPARRLHKQLAHLSAAALESLHILQPRRPALHGVEPQPYIDCQSHLHVIVTAEQQADRPLHILRPPIRKLRYLARRQHQPAQRPSITRCSIACIVPHSRFQVEGCRRKQPCVINCSLQQRVYRGHATSRLPDTAASTLASTRNTHAAESSIRAPTSSAGPAASSQT